MEWEGRCLSVSMVNNNLKNYYFHTTFAGKVSSIYQHPLKKGGQYMDTLRYNVGVVVHFLPLGDLQFKTELFGDNPFSFKDSINLFLLEIPFIFRGSNPFP